MNNVSLGFQGIRNKVQDWTRPGANHHSANPNPLTVSDNYSGLGEFLSDAKVEDLSYLGLKQEVRRFAVSGEAVTGIPGAKFVFTASNTQYKMEDVQLVKPGEAPQDLTLCEQSGLGQYAELPDHSRLTIGQNLGSGTCDTIHFRRHKDDSELDFYFADVKQNGNMELVNSIARTDANTKYINLTFGEKSHAEVVNWVSKDQKLKSTPNGTLFMDIQQDCDYEDASIPSQLALVGAAEDVLKSVKNHFVL